MLDLNTYWYLVLDSTHQLQDTIWHFVILFESPVELTDEQLALVSSPCASRVRYRQHIHVHRWYSCETEKLSWHQPSSFYLFSCRSEIRTVDVRNDTSNLQELRHNDRSCAVVSQVAESMLHSCRFFFSTFLYRLTRITGWPHSLLPEESCL